MEILLDFTLLQAVHIDMDAICEKLLLAVLCKIKLFGFKVPSFNIPEVPNSILRGWVS
jgi:hypothetical protein